MNVITHMEPEEPLPQNALCVPDLVVDRLYHDTKHVRVLEFEILVLNLPLCCTVTKKLQASDHDFPIKGYQ